MASKKLSVRKGLILGLVSEVSTDLKYYKLLFIILITLQNFTCDPATNAIT